MRGSFRHLLLYLCFAVGAIAGGAIAGLLLAVVGGFVNWIDGASRFLVFLSAGLGLVIYDLQVARVRLLQAARQIPQEVFVSDLRWAASRFGFEYGTGLRTYLTSAAPYIFGCAVIFVGVSPLVGLALGAAFGFGRSLSLLQYQIRRKENWQEAVQRQARLLERSGSIGVFLLLALVWGFEHFNGTVS